MSELIVREAKDEDGPALEALARTLLSDNAVAEAGALDHPALDLPATNFGAREGRLWVVMRGEEAVGALGVYRRSGPDEFELALVGLDKDTRGLGLATALLAGAEAFTAASGGHALGLWVDTRLKDAAGFLERHGFVREPGLKGRQDGSDAIAVRFTRAIELVGAAQELVRPQPSEAPPAAGA